MSTQHVSGPAERVKARARQATAYQIEAQRRANNLQESSATTFHRVQQTGKVSKRSTACRPCSGKAAATLAEQGIPGGKGPGGEMSKNGSRRLFIRVVCTDMYIDRQTGTRCARHQQFSYRGVQVQEDFLGTGGVLADKQSLTGPAGSVEDLCLKLLG